MSHYLHTTNRSYYLNKYSYSVSFGKKTKDNDYAGDKKTKDKHSIKYHTAQALLLTLTLLAAQNSLQINNCRQTSSTGIEYYTEMDSTVSDDTIHTHLISFNSPDSHINNKEFNLIAHRGYIAKAPENTIPAFIDAAKMGYNMVEADISWTKDSVPVLLHDGTINRTARYSNGWQLLFPKKCSNLTYNELLKYDFGIWKGKEYEGTKIPTLSEFLECCKKYNLQPYIELKQTSNFDAKKAKILIDSVKEAGMEDSVTWISFNADYLKLISDQMPNSRLGYLSKEFSPKNTLQILKNLKTESNDVFLDIKAKAVSDEMKNQLSDEGFYFEAWAVDTAEDLVNLLAINCNGVTTDILTNKHIQKLFLDMDVNDY